MEQDNTKTLNTGLYGRAIQKITHWLHPSLHRRTNAFVEKAIAVYAKDNPRFARIIEFEVRRRGDGAGLTQDAAEPLLWFGIKTLAALAIASVTESLASKELKIAGRISAIGILLNNAVDLFRLVPRFEAGLQGSLEMARGREGAIQATGVDPFELHLSTLEGKDGHKEDPKNWSKSETQKRQQAPVNEAGLSA